MALHDYDYLFKVALVGEPGVGKSSILTRFADYFFPQSKNLSSGIDFRYNRHYPICHIC